MDTIIDSLRVESLEQPEERKKAFSWLAERVNTFVRVLRPRMRSLAADYGRVMFHPALIYPLPGLELATDEQLGSLANVLLDDFDQRLAVDGNLMPLGFFDPLAGFCPSSFRLSRERCWRSGPRSVSSESPGPSRSCLPTAPNRNYQTFFNYSLVVLRLRCATETRLAPMSRYGRSQVGSTGGGSPARRAA